MKTISFTVVYFLLSSGIASSTQDKNQDDKTQIVGSWKVKEQRPVASPQIEYTKFEFTENKLTLFYAFDKKEGKVECTFSLDSTKNPKTIDFIRTDKKGDGKNAMPYVGIYELKDGRLRICYRGPGSTRPKNFKDEADGNAATTFIDLEMVNKKKG